MVLPTRPAGLFSIKLAGPVHTVFTVTGTSTAGLSSTVQVSETSVSTGLTGLGGLLVILTDVGAGTAGQT